MAAKITFLRFVSFSAVETGHPFGPLGDQTDVLQFIGAQVEVPEPGEGAERVSGDGPDIGGGQVEFDERGQSREGALLDGQTPAGGRRGGTH